METREFYAVVYYEGDEEKREEFSTEAEAREFYENLPLNDDYCKVLQKVVEWENREEYIDELEVD